jgi:hypothetical protein
MRISGRWPFSGVALRDLAAGFVVGLLVAGVANETFALQNPTGRSKR